MIEQEGATVLAFRFPEGEPSEAVERLTHLMDVAADMGFIPLFGQDYELALRTALQIVVAHKAKEN